MRSRAGIWVLPALGLGVVAAAVVGRLAVTKLGGISGDFLGATEQIAESLILVMGAAIATNTWTAARVVAMTVRLWLVRHGSTEWSEAGRYTGSTDLPLSERGKAEARALAWLADRSWAGVWTSDLKRARETARLAGFEATARPATAGDRLRDRWKEQTWAELDGPTRDALVAFDGFAAPGGESTEDLLTRLEAFVDDLPAGDHLAFTHGGVIRALVRSTGADRHPGPGEVVVLAIDGASRKDVSVDFLEKSVDSGRDRSSS